MIAIERLSVLVHRRAIYERALRFILFSTKSVNKIENIRNIGIIAHIDAGKTTTSEQMLYLSGEIDTIGRVDTGDTVMDFLPQERERGITISSAATSFKWKENIINLIDTPGHVDFTIEVERSVRVLDGAVVIVDAVSGVQAQTRTVWKQAEKQQTASILYVNKMDRVGANFERSLKSVQDSLSCIPIAIQVPIGEGETFAGVIDLITMDKITWPPRLVGNKLPSTPIVSRLNESDGLYPLAFRSKRKMLEIMAELDEFMLGKYLDLPEVDTNEIKDIDYFNTISVSEVVGCLRRLCLARLALPTVCGSSLKGVGVELLLNSVSAFLPSPVDRGTFSAVHHGTKRTKDLQSTGTDLIALAFKVDCDVNRGVMVYVRAFSGSISAKQTLFNSSKKLTERVTGLFTVAANQLRPVEIVTAGQVACVMGLKRTFTGDTLVADKSPLVGYELPGLSVPDPVFSQAVEPERSSQQTALEQALHTLCIEDPSLRVEIDKDSGQTVIRGMGELHLEIVCDKLRTRFNIEVSRGRAYVAYRETLPADYTCQDLRSVYDRTLGSRRLFAVLVVSVSSSGGLAPSEVTVFEEVETALRPEELSALMSGLHDALLRGPRGYPVVGLRIDVQAVERDGDTTPGALRACAAVLVDALMRGSKSDSSVPSVLLEPVMALEIEVPSEYLGAVLSDLTGSRRGVVHDVMSAGEGRLSKVLGRVPLATMVGYSSSLRSASQGEGVFSLEYSDHEAVDPAYADKTN